VAVLSDDSQTITEIACMQPLTTMPSQPLQYLFWTVCRTSTAVTVSFPVHWRRSFLLGLTSYSDQQTLSLHWPLQNSSITVTCPCSLRALCHVKVNLFIIIIIWWLSSVVVTCYRMQLASSTPSHALPESGMGWVTICGPLNHLSM